MKLSHLGITVLVITIIQLIIWNTLSKRSAAKSKLKLHAQDEFHSASLPLQFRKVKDKKTSTGLAGTAKTTDTNARISAATSQQDAELHNHSERTLGGHAWALQNIQNTNDTYFINAKMGKVSVQMDVPRSEIGHGAPGSVSEGAKIRMSDNVSGTMNPPIGVLPPTLSGGQQAGLTVHSASVGNVIDKFNLQQKCRELKQEAETQHQSSAWAKMGCECAEIAPRLPSLNCYVKHGAKLSNTQVEKVLDMADGVGTRAMLHTRKILSFGTRVPGETGWNQTIQYIESVLSPRGWYLERDCFVATTPDGEKPMCNIVASFNPQAGRCMLDLAAHHESKKVTAFKFLGATDSVAPVGMLLEIAEALTPLLEERRRQSEGGIPCLRLIFFDGEEAFKVWTDRDSLYGARHMASKWQSEGDPFQKGSRRLDSMSVLVLLDLLGQKNPALTWHFESTKPLFFKLMDVEERLRGQHLLQGPGGARGGPYFVKEARSRGQVLDDHIPFLRKGVPVLHIIAYPFPSMWHKATDDLSAIDSKTVADMMAIFRVWVAELYSLNPASLPQASAYQAPIHSGMAPALTP